MMETKVAVLQQQVQQLVERNEKLSSEVVQLKAKLENQPTQHQDQPLLWRGCSRMPCGFVRPHVVVKGSNVYVGGGNTGQMESTRTIYQYDTIKNTWSSLPITPYYTFSLALVKGYVTVIGGTSVLSALVTNALASYDEVTNKWSHRFPAMPTKRLASSATSTDEYLVVVGGIAENDRTSLNLVEVLDFTTMKWSTASPLPKAVTFMSMTVCRETGRIYMLGGLTPSGAVRSVFSCILSELVKSCHITPTKDIWEVITDSPYLRSGCVAIKGKLLIASGLQDTDDTTTTLHCFDPVTKAWTPLGEMPAARSSCSIATLSGGQVMLVGGYTQPRNWVGSLTRDVMATVNLCVPQ